MTRNSLPLCLLTAAGVTSRALPKRPSTDNGKSKSSPGRAAALPNTDQCAGCTSTSVHSSTHETTPVNYPDGLGSSRPAAHVFPHIPDRIVQLFESEGHVVEVSVRTNQNADDEVAGANGADYSVVYTRYEDHEYLQFKFGRGADIQEVDSKTLASDRDTSPLVSHAVLRTLP